MKTIFKIKINEVGPLLEGLGLNGPWKSLSFLATIIDDDDETAEPQTLLIRARGRLATCLNFLNEGNQLDGIFLVAVRFHVHKYLGSDNKDHIVNDLVCQHFEKWEEF